MATEIDSDVVQGRGSVTLGFEFEFYCFAEIGFAAKKLDGPVRTHSRVHGFAMISPLNNEGVIKIV